MDLAVRVRGVLEEEDLVVEVLGAVADLAVADPAVPGKNYKSIRVNERTTKQFQKEWDFLQTRKSRDEFTQGLLAVGLYTDFYNEHCPCAEVDPRTLGPSRT